MQEGEERAGGGERRERPEGDGREFHAEERGESDGERAAGESWSH